MEKLFFFGAFFAVYALVLILVAPAVRNSRTSRGLFIVLWSLYLAVQVVFFHQLLPLRLSEQISSIHWGTQLMEWKHGSREKAHHFLEHNCTLIDVANDQMLVPAEDLPDSGLTQVITDRRKLTTLLDFLARDTSLCDVVMLDVYFRTAAHEDDSLRLALAALTAQHKLALAYDPTLATNRSIYGDRSLVNAHGDVAEQRLDDVYFQHTLLRPPLEGTAELRLSLPYRAYGLLHGIGSVDRTSHLFGICREQGPGGPRWVNLRYNPLFLLGPDADEGPWDGLWHLLGVEEQARSTETGAVLRPMEALEATEPLGRLVNELHRDPQAPFLTALLHSRMEEPGAHVVFIGNFTDPDRDLHQTAQGTMHGAVMVINILHELLEGGHAAPFRYFLVIWAVLALITWILIRRCLHAGAEHTARSRYKGIELMRRIWNFLIVEEQHYWYLFAMLIAVQVVLGRIVNIMSFVMLMSVMEFIFRTYLPKDAKFPGN